VRVYLILVAACSSPVTPTPPPEPWVAALRGTIEQSCGDCHDGDPQRPVLTHAIGDRELAWTAATMVASGSMPPNVELLDHEREDIVARFCSALGRDADQCMRGTFVGELPSLVRPPKVLTTELAKTWALSPHAIETLGAISSSSTQWYAYDNVNFRASLSLAAMEGCAKASDGVTDRAPADVERCIRGMLARDTVRPTPPPESK
jgi:hypothetical protein